MSGTNQLLENDSAPPSEARYEPTTNALLVALPDLIYECDAFKIDFTYYLPKYPTKGGPNALVRLNPLYRYPDGAVRCYPDGTFPHKEKTSQTAPLAKVYACALKQCNFCSFIAEKAALRTELNRLDGKCTLDRFVRCTLDVGKILLLGLQITLHALAGPVEHDHLGGDYFFQMVPNKSLSPRPPTLSGHLRSQRCDPLRLRSWIDHCFTSHSRCASHTNESAQSFQYIRLIDTERRCVSLIFGNQQLPPFIALSYVWGKSPKHLVLTSANEKELQEEGSLRDLPATLADTIKLLQMLGQRWLWIDSLCIMQDNKQELEVLIPAMQNIYRGALFTVVAAAGTDVDAGLLGITMDREKPIVIPLGNVSLMTAKEYPSGPLASTFWRIRGWTFQEEMLSKRLLIFREDQVGWKSWTWMAPTPSSLPLCGVKCVSPVLISPRPGGLHGPVHYKMCTIKCVSLSGLAGLGDPS